MTSEFISRAVGDICDRHIQEAAAYQPQKKAVPWPGWVAAAACLCLAAGALLAVLPGRDTGIVTLGGIQRKYKNTGVVSSETARIWPWEYMTTAERFGSMRFDGIGYHSRGRGIAPALLGEKLGTCQAEGYDAYTDTRHTAVFDVYRIAGVAAEHLVGVEQDGEVRVFARGDYLPPADLGQVLDEFSLAQNLTLDRFMVQDGAEEQGHFSLSDDGPIWDILSSCRDAAFVEDDLWHPMEHWHLSFTVTSEALGIYKRVLYITADGTLFTNIFDYGYRFDIGAYAAGRIIAWAQEHSTPVQPEPFTSTLAGTLTGVENGYLLVDDTVLCTDAKDGLVFRVSTGDLRIRRCVELGEVRVGDIVQISFNGDIDIDAGNTVPGAYAIEKAYLSDGVVMIPE